MNVRIEESFELLSQQEWDDFLAVNYFDNMIIDGSKFGIIDDFIGSIGKPKLPEIIQQHNNKIGDCKITYCFVDTTTIEGYRMIRGIVLQEKTENQYNIFPI